MLRYAPDWRHITEERYAVTEGQSTQGNSTSSVLGRRLGAELMSLRTRAGLTQTHAAKALSASTGKVAKMEGGWVPVRDPDIRALCTLYGTNDPATVGALLELARIDRERRKAKGWWNDVALTRTMREYVPLENAATVVKAWQVSLIPGLLQTPDYIRSLRREWVPDDDPDQVEAFVTSRAARQQRLSGDNPLSLRVVISEAALRAPVAEPEMLRKQLESLLDWSERPNVTIQVLPFGAGMTRALAGSFNVLSFAEPGAMDVVFLELAFSTTWVEGGEGAARHVRLFEETARGALPEAESRAFIGTLIKGL
ncbi:helix-turn-helix domain-containing protein [Streptomyces niphimycinicus]|uniref:helix-turn-helix domain-containing protein n=1 Tax=Streptomyces niphimycinicus TaxID=2842201 RepID=UPI0027E53E85|nr:helix-turn-helix transcriptional regulator [Streptomyces niphimycinicus]